MRTSRKRGNVVLDGLLYFLILFILGVVLLVGNGIISPFNDQFQQLPDVDSRAKASLSQNTEGYSATGDNIFVAAVILMWIFVFVASFLIDSHPLFYGISLFLLVFIFIVGAVLGNTYLDLSNADSMVEYAADYPKMNWIMEHILEFGVAVVFTTLLGLYGKNTIG